MGSQMENIHSYIDSHKEEMIDLWRDLVDIDSGGYDCKEGVDKIALRIKKELDKDGFTSRIIDYEHAGNALIAQSGSDRSKKGVLFMGHMDTVFSKGTVGEKPFTIKDGKAYGPGVLDMKGGIVIEIFAIRALNAIGYNARPFKVILSGDEETGHVKTGSSELFVEEGKGYAAAFNAETASVFDKIVIGRKAVAHFTMEVKGVGAHAGNDPEKGRSAILELAHKTIDIHNPKAWEEGIVASVGVIEGGFTTAAIPDYAKMKIAARWVKEDQEDRLLKSVENIASRTYVEGTTTALSGGIIYKPMAVTEGNKRLFEIVKEGYRELGLSDPSPVFMGGGSDSAYSVIAGVPTVCSMGVKGEWNHTDREYAVVDTLFERAKLLASCVLKLDDKGF